MRNLLSIFLLLSYYSASCQEYFTITNHIGMEDGLSHYKVLSLYPDKNGMWIGTAEGLNYYDGFNWKLWEMEQLHFKSVDFIHEDPEQNLWLFNTKNTRSKNMLSAIGILDKEQGEVISFSEKFKTNAPFQLNDVQTFFSDKAHQIYFFANQKLWKYADKDTFEQVKLPKGFEPTSTFIDGTFAGLQDKMVALVSPRGELIYNTHYKIDAKLIDFLILGNRQKFMIWQTGHIIHDHQLFVKQTNGDYKISPIPFLSDDKEGIHPLYFDDEKNQFWLYKKPRLYTLDFDGNTFSSLLTDIPRVASIDHNDNLWCGENGLTVIKKQPQKFKRFLYQDAKVVQHLNLFRCRGLVEKNGKLYITTYLGTKVVNLSNGEVTTLFDKKHKKFVVMKDQQNQLWFGKHSLVQLDKTDSKIVQNLEYEDPNNADRIWSMLQDSNGDFWIGEEELSFVKNGKLRLFKKYNEFTQLKKATIYSLFKDKNGVIWVVSSDGLYQLDSKKGIIAGYGKNRNGKFKLPSNKFQHIYQDAEGIYWLATEDVGLIKWNKATGEIKIFDTKHGFLSKNIYSVYEDNFGFLWMSSFNGLIRFDKSQERAIVFTEEDGITKNEFNRISHYQTEEGYIYFGGQNGVTGFDPKDFLTPLTEQKYFQLSVNHISVFGKKTLRDTLSDGSTIDLTKLSAGNNVIDLEIACSDIFWTSGLELHYTLEKLGKSEFKNTSREFISADNHVELFGIQPGEYQLEIKAINNNGKQIGKTLLVPIRIAPSFFQTYPFWISLFLTIGVGSWGLIKYRTARLKKRKVELEKQVKERTEQIFKDQKTIKSQAEQIVEMREQLNKKDELWLEQLQTIINDRLEDTNLDLPSIIENLDIGRSQFFEKVKSLTKMTPNQYIQEIRLIKAKEILETGDVRTVKEVAYSVGIRRPGYFSKLFKDRFGILPSEYFRNHRN